MMALQPNNSAYFQPKAIPFNSVPRKASVEESEPTEGVNEAESIDPEMDEMESIKNTLDKKKEVTALKNKKKAKADRTKLFKRIAIGVGAVAGTVVTAGVGLGAYWYCHNPKPPVTGDEMIKLAGNMATMTDQQKTALVKQFEHLNLGLDPAKGAKGFKKWITGVQRSSLMAKQHKDQVVRYLFTKGGVWDYLFAKDTKFKSSMANITGEIFATKAKQKNVSRYGSIAHNLEAARAKQNQGRKAGSLEKADLIEWKVNIPKKDNNGQFVIETVEYPLSETLFKAVGEIATQKIGKIKGVTDRNTDGLNIADYLPAVKEAITETLNPLLKQRGLAEVDASKITVEMIEQQGLELGSGTVAKVFRVVAEDGRSYAAKVVHPAVNKEVFPNILQREIIRLQQEAEKAGVTPLSHRDAVLIAMEKLGNVAQETDLVVEHKVHQNLYENAQKYSTVKIHEALGLHNKTGKQVAFQEVIEGLTQIDDSSNSNKAEARIHVFTNSLCEMLTGNMHGDLHPGNLGFDADGNIRELDFGKNIFLAGDTPKHIRNLTLQLLDDKPDMFILQALETINPDTFKRLPEQRKTELVSILKESPFRMVDKLFQYHFFDQPNNLPVDQQHINVNFSALKDRTQLGISHRVDAGLNLHTNYKLGLWQDITPKEVKKYSDNTHLYSEDTASNYMQTYLDDVDVILRTLFQDDPSKLQDPQLKAKITRKVLDEIAMYCPAEDLTLGSLSYLSEDGEKFNIGDYLLKDFQASSSGVPGADVAANLFGGVIKGVLNSEFEEKLKKFVMPPEFDELAYLSPIPINSSFITSA
jgi:ABC1 atypical kinase-like domain